MSREYTEYVFVGQDGVEHYEFVGEARDVWTFKRMHNARLCMPVRDYEKTQRKEVPCDSRWSA